MKKILITAQNSYIGNTFAERTSKMYDIDFISCRTNDWEKEDFSKYDSILHVAGIAHVSKDPNMESEYYRVNRDLTVKIAKKSKKEGVKQFIFLSSIIVYGDNSEMQKKTIITPNTVPKPSNFYGMSKLQAEAGILALQNENYNISIIRPPMVYGENSKGNYRTLVKIAEKIPVFPNLKNERSMIHIDNLCEFIHLLIKNNEKGLFFPQNKTYINTSNMVKTIAEANGKKIKLTTLANPILYVLSKKVSILNKAFGSLTYEKHMSVYKEEYQIRE